MKKILLYVICFVVIIGNIFCINSYATDESENNGQQEFSKNTEQILDNDQSQNIEEFCEAEVKSIGAISNSDENPNSKIQEITLEVLDGTYKGKEVTANYVISNKDNYEKVQLEVGDEVYVIINGDVQGNLFVSIQSLRRNGYIWVLLVILLFSILFLYEKHSIKPILSIIITILLLYFGLFKLIINGFNTILVTILFGIVLTIIEFIINNGFNKKIWISIIGSFSGIFCSTIIALIFTNLERINVNYDSLVISEMNYNNLMIIGAMISSLGACLSISMYIIESLDKKKIETKDFFRKDLFKLGVIYGKKQAIKFIYTLLIVFVGISFGMIMMYSETYDVLFNSFSKDYIAMGIISIVSTCVGIIISVLMTSIIYSLINSKKTIYKTTSENKLNGKRSLKI